ncbi:DUF6485 family protein [[Eubacterium] cellulosolvens]
MECQQDINKENCSCTYEPCSRKGLGCECIRYHRSMGQLPGCVFPPEVERTCDRSVERFIAYNRK